MSAREWWTVKQFAQHYGLGTTTVYDMIDRKELTVYRLGGIKIKDSDRLAWEDARRVEAAPKERAALAGATRSYVPKHVKV